LKLNLDVTELSMAPVGQPCELIAISAASSSYNNYGIKETLDESVERRRVTMNNAKPPSGYTTEYYNVLWIEWHGKSAYRKALGKVRKRDWERQTLDEIEVTLG
jgi:hypothetical protein